MLDGGNKILLAFLFIRCILTARTLDKNSRDDPQVTGEEDKKFPTCASTAPCRHSIDITYVHKC